MDIDPWNWGVADVQRFFQQDAIRFIADRPSGQLPPLNAFVRALSDKDMDGASLLDTLTTEALRDEFGIGSFRFRGSILHCIRKLQSLSQSYRSRGASLRPQTPTPLLATPIFPPPSTEQRTVLPSTEGVGEKVRQGEVQIEDAHGRKRRKLDLGKADRDPAQHSVELHTRSVKSPEDATSYLPDSALAVDELFYGPTGFGHVIGELGANGNILVDHHGPDTADDNFQFTSPHKHRGEAQSVYSRLQYFLTKAEVATMRRRDRDAVAILPYKEGAHHGARSATVVQVNKDNEYVAVREQASMLQGGYDYSGMDQASTNEWDFLLQNHQQKDNEKIVSIEGDDSESGEVLTTTAESEQGKAPEAIEDNEEGQDQSRIVELIDKAIEACIAEWHGTLQELEAKRAWSVWKKMKQSRTLRDALIDTARARINDLTRRLTKLREELMKDGWSSDQNLQHACGSLEPTVQDIEEQKWMISVWQRRKEPAHVVQHKANQATAHAALQTPATDQTSRAFVVPIEDRMSVSPTPAMHIGADPPLPADDEGDQFHTPNGSPPIVPGADTDVGVDVDGFEASDEMSLDDHHESELDPLSDLPESEEHVNGYTSSPPAPVSPRSSTTEQEGEISVSDHEKQTEQWNCPSCLMSLYPDQQAVNEHLDNCLSERAIKEADEASSDELPSPSRFVSQAIKRAPETLERSRQHGISTQPIDLTLSSDSHGPASSPTPVPRKKKGKGKGMAKKPIPLSADASAATSAEVDSWDFAALMKNNDRYRILIKIVRDEGAKKQEGLHQCLLTLGTPKARADQVRAAARTHETGNAEEEGLEPKTASMMLYCARLCSAWWFLDPAYLLDPESREIRWDELYNDINDQCTMFIGQLLKLLKMKGSELFSGPKKTHPKVTNISDTDDTPHDTPHKRRKRPVQQSQTAKLQRNAAKARQEQYAQVIESQQTTDSTQLAAMIASDPSNSDIAINLVKNQGDEFVYIHPKIARKMKRHQIDGARFLWREITVDDEDGGQGCLLAHTMGLGKTMQTIALLVAVLEASESTNPRVYRQLPAQLRPEGIRNKRQLRILILCPPSLLTNWRREIEQWAPKTLGNPFVVEASSKNPKALQMEHMGQLEDWYRVGGVLLIGYAMFRSFVIRKGDKRTESEDAWLDKMLLEGPEIVVADEAHNLKNTDSAISKAATAIKTHTRIALTGTPMSNDIQEIYALVSFVAPGFLGEPQEFRARFAEPIQDGTWEESTRFEIRRSIMKLQVLQAEIEPKVNRADITALEGSLKPKVEFVITVPLTATQDAVYRRYVTALLGGGRNEKASQVTIFGWLSVLGLLTTHPSTFRRKLLAPRTPNKGKKAVTRDTTPTPSEDGSNATSAVEPETSAEQLLEAEADGDPVEEDLYALGFTEGMIQNILGDLEQDLNPEHSAKATIFLDIVRLSYECNDKVLVFSSSIPTLQYLADLLAAKGFGFGRIDGKVPIPKRTQLIENFHNDRFNILLVSTKAGGVGLNIQGANRVVIIDFGFNPSWEEQAIGRAYRLGQTKPVFVYRFLAGGTFEANIWNKQKFKISLTQRVVDKKNPQRNAQRNTREYLHDPKPVPQEDMSRWIGKDPMVLDKILSQHGMDKPGKSSMLFRAILTTETLQQAAQDEPLNEEEKREVAKEIKLGMAKPRGRKAAAAQGITAAKSTMAPVHPSASTQALQAEGSAYRSSTSQKRPDRGMASSTAPAAPGADDPQPIAGLPFNPSFERVRRPYHGQPGR